MSPLVPPLVGLAPVYWWVVRYSLFVLGDTWQFTLMGEDYSSSSPSCWFK